MSKIEAAATIGDQISVTENIVSIRVDSNSR